MPDFFKSLVKGSLIYGLGAVAGSIVSFFLLPIYTRFLTPSDYGILEILTTTISILTILYIFGMDNSLFRFSFDSKNENYQKSVLATTNVFIWSLTILATFVLLVNAGFLSRLLFHQKDYVFLLSLAFASAAIITIHRIPMSIFRINNEPTKYTSISVLQILLTTSICIFFVVVLKKGVLGIMAGRLIAVTGVTLVAYYLLRGRMNFGFSFDLLKRMLKYAIPVIPAGLALWVLNLSDRYFLLAYSTTTELGLYGVGAKLASPVSLLIMAFRLAWPQAAFSVLNHDNKNRLYAQTLTYFVAIICSIVLGLSLFSDELVSLMATKKFFSAAKVIPILGLGLAFNGCYTIFAIGMNITKKMGMLFPVTAIPAGINLVLNYFLITPYGMMGAAWATLISYFLMALLSWQASERVYPIKYEWRRIGRVFGVMLGILLTSKFIHFEQLYFLIPIKFGLFLLYFVVVYAANFSREKEGKYIKSIVARLHH